MWMVGLLGCSGAPCTPVSETPIEPGGTELTREVLGRALQDFVAWSGRDVCVRSVSIATEHDDEHATVEVEDDPDRARQQAFYDLCLLADPDLDFALAHPMAFSGQAIPARNHEQAVHEDFARSCAIAAGYGPWVEMALAACDEPSTRSEVLVELFGEPGAGFPYEPWPRETLGTLPPFDGRLVAVVGDQLLFGRDEARQSVLDIYALPSLEWIGSHTRPPELHALVQGYTTALWVGLESGEVFEVLPDGLVEGVPLRPDAVGYLAQDAHGWWMAHDTVLYSYDPLRGLEPIHDDHIWIASGDPLWVWTHDGVSPGGDLWELQRRVPGGGMAVVLGGHPYGFVDVWPHHLIFDLADEPVVVDAWCNGAQEWTQPTRRFVANRDWRLEVRYTRSFWSYETSDTEVVRLDR